MFSFKKPLAFWIALCTSLACHNTLFAQSKPYEGIGRKATQGEIAAWDIDVRPDFKGLPKGAGSVSKGQDVWEGKCASCHGVFGESNEVFSPLVGGTTKEDVKTGRVARLKDDSFPGRTTLMKVPHLSTLWDYINRAMPWNQPKSLSADEVYAVTAYLLNLGGIVPENFTLSHDNMAATQALMPNRNGMQTRHGLWPGKSMGSKQTDIKAVACMSNCGVAGPVASSIPDYARDAHGNLADQNRLVGAQKGQQTTKRPANPVTPSSTTEPIPPSALLQKYACVGCHAVDSKVLGPSFREIGQKYAGKSDAAGYLSGKIRNGASGVWGSVPMPGQALPDADMAVVVKWLMELRRP
jgi:S-disulfanyl-L-cysteine oxidoreductase SoxD